MVACRTYQYYSFNLLKRFWEKEAEENKDSTLKNCKSRSEIKTSNYKYSPESFLYTQKWLKCRSQLRFGDAVPILVGAEVVFVFVI
jgi:hypothetical protein